jgi:D-amino-acid oxidase
MAQVTVVGAGVIGLTTALALREAGHKVAIVAKARGSSITSAAAGAIWFPFRSPAAAIVNRWATLTRQWQTHLAATNPDMGVDLVTLEVFADTPERPWWAASVPELQTPERGGDRAPFIWRFVAPRIDPTLFCRSLEHRFEGCIEERDVRRLDEVEGDVVVNCTGLGARRLCGDAELKGLFGQTVIVSPRGLDLSLSISDERDEANFFYSIPRRGEVVLGGCAIEHEAEQPAVPTLEMRRLILDRAAAYGLRVGEVLRDSAGVRPWRASVRLEREGRVIHNYGHGGSGYTLCRGCALDVVDLVARITG